MTEDNQSSSKLPKFGHDTTDFPLWHFKLLGEAYAKEADTAFYNDLPPEPTFYAADPNQPTETEVKHYNDGLTKYKTDNKDLLKATRKATSLIISSLSDGNLRLISHLVRPSL